MVVELMEFDWDRATEAERIAWLMSGDRAIAQWGPYMENRKSLEGAIQEVREAVKAGYDLQRLYARILNDEGPRQGYVVVDVET